LNQRPHPYQGCALTELSYRPGGRCSGAFTRPIGKRTRGSETVSIESAGLRVFVPALGYRRSDSVTSMPPTTSESKLYRKTTNTLISVQSTTIPRPIASPRLNNQPPWISKV